jgi:hypothetical protein
MSENLRIMLFNKGDMNIMWLGNHEVRYFKTGELPESVKSKLDVINAQPHAKDRANLEMKIRNDKDFDFDIAEYPEGTDDVSNGYRVNKYLYAVILSEEEIEEAKNKVNTIYEERKQS